MKDYLLLLQEKMKNLQEQLQSIESQDPYNRSEYADENTQDDDASEREEHTRVEAIKKDLKVKIQNVADALSKIENNNSYGVCEKCKNKIDNARLKVLPEASLCISCQRSSVDSK